MKCIVCSAYFKQSSYNKGLECDDCIDQIFHDIDKKEQDEAIEEIVNPSGKTLPVYIE